MVSTISIVLIADESFVMPTSVAIVSILRHRRVEIPHHIYVVTPGMRSEQKQLLESLSADGGVVSVVEGELGKFEYLHDDDKSVAHMSATKAALLKFDLPALFPHLDKILYLDGDIIVRGDLSELFFTELGEYYLAAAHDTGKMYFSDPMLLEYPGYFNSGMMLLNLKKMRENDSTERLVVAKEFLSGKSLMDQPAFNVVFHKQVLHVSSKWNYLAVNLDRASAKWNITQLNELLHTDYADKEAFRDDAVVIHYSSKEKPWKHHTGSWTDLWYKYYLLSPFSKERLPWQKSRFLLWWVCSIRKEGVYRVMTLFGTTIRFKDRSLERRLLLNNLRERLEELERELGVFRNHQQSLLQLSAMYQLPSVNRDAVASAAENYAGCGVRGNAGAPRLVVSLSGHPEHIYDLHLTLYSLLSQSHKPDKVILWLSESEFPNKEQDIPGKVLMLRERGLEIRWCTGNRPYQKIIPALSAFPDAAIVTADGNLYYGPEWLKKLWDAYESNGEQGVYAHHCHCMTIKSGIIAHGSSWRKYTREDGGLPVVYAASGGGVLYAPGCLDPEVMNEEKAQALCSEMVDVWLWAMGALRGSYVRAVDAPCFDMIVTNPGREVCSLPAGTQCSCGKTLECQLAFKRVMAEYPQLSRMLSQVDLTNNRSISL